MLGIHPFWLKSNTITVNLEHFKEAIKFLSPHPEEEEEKIDMATNALNAFRPVPIGNPNAVTIKKGRPRKEKRLKSFVEKAKKSDFFIYIYINSNCLAKKKENSI